MAAKTHTPTPWTCRGLSDHVRIERRNEVGYVNVARCGSSKPGPHEPDGEGVWANAEFIVTACNSFEQMRDALTAARDAMNYMGDILNGMDCVMPQDSECFAAFDKVRAALAAAKGATK